MSSPEIAKIYRCRPEYVRHLLRKYNIRIRTKSEARRLLFNINIPKKELEELYLKEKLSSPGIAGKFNCSPGFVRNELRRHRIPIRTIQEALPLSNKPIYPRYNFSGNLEEEAYLIGLRKGDLYIHSANQANSTILVNTNSSKPEMIKLLIQIFSPYGHVWQGNPDKVGVVGFHCYLNKTFSFLLEKKDRIEPWILRNRKYFAAFSAGYVDAEGTFCLCGGKAVFSIKSQDKNILHQIQAKLIELGILLRPPQIVRKQGTRDKGGTISNKDIWGISVYRKDSLLKLIDLLNPYLKHADKRKRIKILKNNIFWRNKEYNRHQSTKWDKLYLREGVKYVRSLTLE
ncbi:MAG: hypothetical protein COS49_01500 [Candidatus Portnoybacteria bacterium CG03_land_8_20_14_0_80_41_10]|uniref:DOD-type homing endonuclease domain-containing protein n=1 Tax=Candidatus Portnoybacteria bacterium CG03_land_8_20_14_0_80_41_10 TaxID=1974808 RepID=A0A2M7BUK5_9BACT|nr:MAG: hypothetical protein COS49_01500 [Candidatus Portnoybacteria bacterium CG03_land_8_20_14_0_80_41_10]